MGGQRFSTRAHRSSTRVMAMAVVGVAIALTAGALGAWPYAPVLGWAGASLTYLVWVWAVIGRLDGSQTAAHARRDDPGRVGLDILVLAGTLGSLGAVGLILVDARSAEGGEKAGILVLAVASIALSWFLVHTLYTLRYATLYHEHDRGVDFNEMRPPRYLDFAYLSFTIGMTFQVSDTNLGTEAIRYTALRQALLSYLLGAIVLATTVNLVAGLAG